MIEISTDLAVQRAFQKAHSERGAFVRRLLNRIFAFR